LRKGLRWQRWGSSQAIEGLVRTTLVKFVETVPWRDWEFTCKRASQQHQNPGSTGVGDTQVWLVRVESPIYAVESSPEHVHGVSHQQPSELELQNLTETQLLGGSNLVLIKDYLRGGRHRDKVSLRVLMAITVKADCPSWYQEFTCDYLRDRSGMIIPCRWRLWFFWTS
jgi:hypothetical protein